VLSVALGGPKAAQGAKNAGGAPERAPFPAFLGVSVAAVGKNIHLHGADNQRRRKKSKKRRKKVQKMLARKGKSCNFAAVFAPTIEAVWKRGRAKVL
jgi:ribosomal protein L31E